MKTFTFLVITLLFCHKAIAGEATSKKCNINEVYTTCGTACPLTCDNYKNPPTVCTKQCIIGCVCKPDYVKNGDGKCVLPKDCKPKVPRCLRKYEEYNDCGSACPLTCENHLNPPICTLQCVPGCYCQKDYVRNEAGDCVPPCECPKVPQCLRKYEEYDECGTACPLSCENYLNPQICTKHCVPGCYCKNDYVRNEAGDCVSPCECPKVPRCLRKYEEYNECGSACPLTCENHLNQPICTLQCVPGCYCQKGYVRNEAGDCVPPCECPKVPQCPKHEIYTECGTACPLTCNNYKNPPKFCTMNCVVGCQCEAGYVRNEANNKCVLPCNCPAAQPTCKKSHESYNTCGTACPLTCENYKNPPPCTRQCVAGCFCEQGFVRNEIGNCVSPCDC